MSRVISAPRVIQNNFDQNRKKTRVAFNGPAQNNLADSQPVNETTTRVIPYQSTNWSVLIEPESCVFIATPDKRRQEKYIRPGQDEKFMLHLVQLNVVLHQASLTWTLFSEASNGAKKRLAQLDDLLCMWSYRGVNQTRKAEGSMQLNGPPEMTRNSTLSVHRDMVAWFRGDTFCFNYWGNVPGGGTQLYFVLKKVRINANTDYKLSDTLIASEHNHVRNDRNGDPEEVIEYEDIAGNVVQEQNPTREMVFQWVPMYPGCPTFDNPKGNITPRKNLTIEELSYVDYDAPLFDPTNPLERNKIGKPEFYDKKIGHPVLVGICIANPSFNPRISNTIGSIMDSIRDTTMLIKRKKLAIYAFNYSY